MKKNKTSLGSVSQASYLSSSTFSQSKLDLDLATMQQGYKQNDQQILVRKNKLLQKQLQLQKQSKKALQKQLQAYRNIVLKNCPIHQLLQLQHTQIFQLQTSLQILQNKYDKLLNSNGSGQQTQYAIKCKQLHNMIKSREVEHQKEVAELRGKIMKMSANEIVESNRGNGGSNGGGGMTPVRNNRKLV